MEIRFNDIAGYKEEKQEVINFCKMFKNYETYKEMGIKLPKGLLFYGPPGVGKTLFSKAIATELERNFFEVNFSEISNGDTAQNIKEVFEEAKNNTPSIIFIDELDKIVPIESQFDGYISDESRALQTLLLQMLDGFVNNGDVMIIATANNLRGMSRSLTRSGRIDKHIYLGSPNDESREEIINYYLEKVNFDKDIDINQIILSTVGKTGADIATMINQALIEVTINELEKLTTKDVLKQLAMIDNKDLIKSINKEDAEIVSVHELGHYVVAKHYNHNTIDISLINSRNSLGRVRTKRDSMLQKTNDVLEQATILLAGRAAEVMILNEIYTGSRQDIEEAYKILSHAVAFGEFGFDLLDVSKVYRHGIELNDEQNQKVKELFKECFDEAKRIVNENSGIINQLKPILIEKQVLTKQELIEMESNGFLEHS